MLTASWPSAIDRPLPPDLTARFAADLTRLWPEGADGGGRLGVAVSGGPDSLALLMLAEAALPGQVEAATVDHGLRPESADEAAMVADACRARGIPHRTLAVTLAPGNLQHQARAARYRALAGWCGERGLAALATGHQLDDQAETLVMRLARGSGLAGLAGVRARGVVPESDLPLLRPLLGWGRAELEALVLAAGLAPARDPSNNSDRFDRVRVRKALAQADWLDAPGLAQSAALLGEAESYLASAIERAWSERVVQEGGAYRLRPGASDFETVELARRIVAALGGDAVRSDVASMVTRLRGGQNASLAGVLARVERSGWLFAPEPPRKTG